MVIAGGGTAAALGQSRGPNREAALKTARLVKDLAIV